MNSFKVVALTYHQKFKFPMGGRIGEVHGDQAVARKCYIEMVSVDLKKARLGRCTRVPKMRKNRGLTFARNAFT